MGGADIPPPQIDEPMGNHRAENETAPLLRTTPGLSEAAGHVQLRVARWLQVRAFEECAKFALSCKNS